MSFSNKNLIDNNFNLSASQNFSFNTNSRNSDFIPVYQSTNILSDKKQTLSQTFYPNHNTNFSAINQSSFSPQKRFRTIEHLDDSNSNSPKYLRPALSYFIKPRFISIRENVLNKIRKEKEKTYSELNIKKEPKDHIPYKSHSNDFRILNPKRNYYTEKKPKDGIISFFKGNYFGGLPSHSVFHFKTSNENQKWNTSIETEISNFGAFNENKNDKKKEKKESRNNSQNKNKNKKKNYEKDPLDNIGSSVMNLIKNNQRKSIQKNQKKPLDSLKPDLDKSINEEVKKIVINEQKGVKSKNSLNNINDNIAPKKIQNFDQPFNVYTDEKEKNNIINENNLSNKVIYMYFINKDKIKKNKNYKQKKILLSAMERKRKDKKPMHL